MVPPSHHRRAVCLPLLDDLLVCVCTLAQAPSGSRSALPLPEGSMSQALVPFAHPVETRVTRFCSTMSEGFGARGRQDEGKTAPHEVQSKGQASTSIET